MARASLRTVSTALRAFAWEAGKTAILLVQASRRIGAIGATQLIIAKHRRTGTVSIKIKGFQHPVFLRSGTSDVLAVEYVLVSQEYDEPHLTLRSPIIVDAGANIGCASVYFANRFPHARILAVEPDLENMALLLRNTERYPNIEIVHGALWPIGARLAIKNASAASWSYRIGEKTDGGLEDGVPAVTMDDILAKIDQRRIGLLKIDIEGAEFDLFTAVDRTWLESIDAVAIEFHDRYRPGSANAFYKSIKDWSFNQFTIGENVFVYRS